MPLGQLGKMRRQVGTVQNPATLYAQDRKLRALHQQRTVTVRVLSIARARPTGNFLSL